MVFKAVHCADIHIGAPFSGLSSSKAALRKEEVRTSFLNIINYCKEKSVDALFICGDLFDCPNPSKNDCEFTRKAFEALAPIPVYIIAGNHDYICAGSPFSREKYFSENVHIFPCFEHSFEITEKNVVIYGKSYSGPSSQGGFENQEFDKNKLNIMCLHGDMSLSGDYCAVKKEVLSSLPCNYAAFGHIHSGDIFEINGVKCAYSGTPEGHGFDDCGKTGFIYAEISKDKTDITYISQAIRNYSLISCDVTGKSTDEVIKNLKNTINRNDLYKITLVGECNDTIDIALLKDALEDFTFFSDIYDRTTAGYDFDLIQQEESLRGEFLRELRKIAASEEEFILSGKAGLDALSGRTPCTEVDL